MQTQVSAITSKPAIARGVAPTTPAVRQRTVHAGNRHRQARLEPGATLLGLAGGPIIDTSVPNTPASLNAGKTVSLQSVVLRAFGSAGRPLEPKTRQVMEEYFQYDFSKVRLHDDHRAAATARLLGARAFTVGWDIGLQPSIVHLGIAGGRRTLAHELAHVRQSRGQRPSRSRSVVVSGRAEREASAAAEQVTEGSIVRSPLSHSLGIFCERDPRLGEILQELPFRISLYRRARPGANADQVAEFLMRYLANVDLQDRDNRVPVLDVLRAQVGPDVFARFLDRLDNVARAAVAVGQLAQQEEIRGLMAVRRTPGLVLPILLRPAVSVTAGVPAFLLGIAEGFSALGSDDAARFTRLLPTLIVNSGAVFAGVTFGMDRAIITQAVEIARLVTSREQLRQAANGILQLLLSPQAEDIAREMGRHIGSEHVVEIRQMLDSRGARAAFRFGVILGPVLLTIYLLALSFGAAARGLSAARGAQMANELARVRRPSRLTRLVQSLYERYPRFERRVNYALNRVAAAVSAASSVFRNIPLFSNLRMLRYLRRLRSHSLMRAVRQTYAELRSLRHTDPRYRLRAIVKVDQLQRQFARGTGMEVHTLRTADVVNVRTGAISPAQSVQGIQIRRIDLGGSQVPAVLVEPGLASDPVRHFFELAHDIATYVTQSGGGENPVLAEAAAILQARYSAQGITFLEATHAGRLLEISMLYDLSLEQTVAAVARRPAEVALDYARLAGAGGEYSRLGRFPSTPPPPP